MSAREVSLSRRGLLAGGVALTAGCAGVPTSGPAQQVSPAEPAQEAAGVEIRPVPPAVGATPDVILAGFIDAMASLEPDHTVARQYLTQKAALSWDPAAGVTVFDGDTRSTALAGSSVTLHAMLTGRLDPQGHHQPSSAGQALRLTFQFERVDAQWRISNPPPGLLVSQYTLQHRFSPVTVWFLGESQTVVPEQVWLAASRATPTLAVQALLQGPSAWLAPAVTSGLPVGTKLAQSSVTVQQDVAVVALDRAAAGLPESQRSQVMQQLAFTLQPFDEVGFIRVLVDGQPWPVGSDSTGTAQASSLRGAIAYPSSPQDWVAAVQRGRAGRLDAAGSFTPVDGWLGTRPWSGGISHVAMQGDQVAVVDRSGAQLVTRTGEDAPVVRAKGTALGRPQLAANGSLWVADGQDGTAALSRSTGPGVMTRVNLTALAGARIQAFSVAPDLARLAVVLERGDATELGLLRVHDGVVDGYRRLPMLVSATELVSILDVGWANPSQLAVLAGARSQGQPSVWLVSTDASQISQQGPSGDVAISQLVTLPQQDGLAARVLLPDGQVLRYDGAWRWPTAGQGITALGPAS